jgi:ABC-type sugar transport system, periplasmic component
MIGRIFMNIKRVLILLMTVCLMATMILSGCGSTGNSSGTTSSKADTNKETTAATTAETTAALPSVDLSWYTMSFKQPDDTALVEEAMNKILLEKINARIKINVIPFANYPDKINVMLAGGEPIDVMFISGSTLGYSAMASKGALVDLTDLIPKDAPELQNVLSPDVFNATRINGRIYAVPNLQGLCMPTQLGVRKDLFEKYNMPSSIKSFDELDDSFDKILKDEKVLPLSVSNSPGGASTYSKYVINSADFLPIGQSFIPGCYTSDLKVINQYESDHFKNWTKWARKAYLKGWISKNAATDNGEKETDGLKNGTIASTFNAGGPQGKAGMNSQYNREFAFIDFGVKPLLTTTQIQNTMNCISSTSKNPDRAMMLMNLINTDKELYNLMCFGIEGTHYILKDGFRELPAGITDDTNRYNMFVYFFIGNTYNRILQKGEDPNLMQQQKDFDAKATAEPAMGFNYNVDAVKTETAQVASVLEEYISSLSVGAVDPDKYLPEMLAKLKAAGADKIIEDKQKQLDAFMASKK